ncbi:hypothetical protein [Pontibacter ummariensis]|nr:hypothetical protein [Pontibacter ummariensis]
MHIDRSIPLLVAPPTTPVDKPMDQYKNVHELYFKIAQGEASRSRPI